MTQIRMFDGQVVDFGDMSREEINAAILQKYPDAKEKSAEGFVSNAWEDAQGIYEALSPLPGKALKNPKKAGEYIIGPYLGAFQKAARTLEGLPDKRYAEEHHFEPWVDSASQQVGIIRRGDGKFGAPDVDLAQAGENFYDKPFTTAMSGLSLVPGLGFLPGMLGRASRTVSRATNPVNLTGQALTNVAKRAVTPIPARPADIARATWLEQRIGVPVSAGQAVNSPTLKWLEETFSNIDHEPAKRAYTRRAAADAGIRGLNDVDMLDDHALRARYAQFTPQFQQFHTSGNLNRSPQFVIDAQRAFDEYARHSGNSINYSPEQLEQAYRNSEFFNVAERLRNGSLTAGQYHALRSAWSKASMSGADDALKGLYHDMVEALDDVAEQSLSPQARANFARLRREYRNYKAVEHAMGPGGDADTAAGLVTPRRLEQGAGKGKFRGQYARGQSDYTNLAKAGKSVIGNQPPQTGAWPRNFMNKFSAGVGGLSGAGGGAAIGFGLGGPVGSGLGAAIGAGTGLLGQYVFGKAIGSRTGQRWLRNQALPWDTPGAREAGQAAGVAGRQVVAVENQRQLNLKKAETVLSKDVLSHAKRTKELRKPLNEWLKSGDERSRMELATAIAQNLKVPQMAERIFKELGEP